MEVKLLRSTDLAICSKAIRTCWDSHDKSDNGGDVDKALIERVANKNKHESVKNHINYTFEIKGIATKTLLALTRHDIGVEFSVQSTRYTTSKSVKNGKAGYTKTRNILVNKYLKKIKKMIKECVDDGASNDDISMLLPQAWNYNLICTMSMTALQHFLYLRTKKDAHYNIQELAFKMYKEIPMDHKFLFREYIYTDKEDSNGK